MRDIFESELRQIGDGLIEMSRLVETAIYQAGQALLNKDLELAQKVISGDEKIDLLEQELDERCVLLLAQQAPVATDLRIVVTSLRISSILERMGDLARHIAQIARGRFPHSPLNETMRITFSDMDGAAVRLANRITSLLTDRRLDVAASIERDDDLLDQLHQDTFTALLSKKWTGEPQETIDLTLLSRYYERFGDHGVSIARRVVYAVTGDFGANTIEAAKKHIP